MCKEDNLDFKLLKVSNRSTGLHTITAATTFQVNIPSELRVSNKKILVEVVSGCLTLDTTQTTFATIRDCGVSCNLCNGYNTEINNGFNSTNLTELFNVNLNCFSNVDASNCFYKQSSTSFMINSLPEQLRFSRVAVIGNTGLSVPYAAANEYISFILKLTYYDK